MDAKKINLLIVGAGCTGREVLLYAKDCINRAQEFSVKGFIDPNPDALKGYGVDVEIIGNDNYMPQPNDAFIITMQDPDVRERLALQLKEKGARLFSIVHPMAYIASSAQIGSGCIIAPLAFIGANSVVSDNVLINVGAVVGHNAKIGEYSVICPGASASGMTILEKKVFMGTNSVVTPGYKVGQSSRITAGSVVYKDIEANHIAAGNPAKTRFLVR